MDYNVQKMHEKSDNVQNVQDLNGLWTYNNVQKMYKNYIGCTKILRV